MTLKRKILTSYGVAVALMGLVVVWAITNLVSLGRATEAILSENYRSILAAQNMVDALERQDSAVLLVLVGDASTGSSQFHDNEAVFLEWLGRAEDNITIPGEAEVVQLIENDFASYRAQFSALLEARARGDADLGPADYQEALYPRFAAVREDCVDLRKLNEQTMYTASLRATVVAKRAIWSTALVAAAALILALVFSWFLAERISQPVRRFMEASRKISSGDYTVEVPVETSDELGHLAGEINHMAQQLGRYQEINIDQIIAERNKSEAVLASIEDGLVIFDTSLKVTAINAAARRMLGSEVSEISSPQFSEILPSGQLCDLIRRTVETGASPEVPDEQRVVVIPKAEGPVHLLCSITAIRGRDRVLSGVVLMLRDVTRLQEVERLKSEFVMAASHELRTPLTSLGLSVDLLLEHAADNLPERDRDLLRAAQEEVQRMKALVSDLLDLSKIEAGKISLQFQCVPVSTLFDNVDQIFASQLDMHGVVLTTELSGEIPDVRADTTKMTWVLTNLVSNAMRYVSRGGHISLLARRVGSHVHLSVRDDGPGIHPDDQGRIFEKFVQVKGHEGGGSGLGLAICREIVRAHGGLIWVDSAIGQGSTFTFTLPVAH